VVGIAGLGKAFAISVDHMEQFAVQIQESKRL
jgi:hypothetical protein